MKLYIKNMVCRRCKMAVGLELGIKLELIDDKKSKTMRCIKNLIIDLVYSRNKDLKTTLSQYLESKLWEEYSALSKLLAVRLERQKT